MDETRVNASYLARLVGFILALILFALVIWFVVQLGQDENGVVVTDDEENSTTSVIDGIIGDGDVIVVDGNGDGSQVAATDSELEATTVSTSSGTVTIVDASTANESAVAGSTVAGTAVGNVPGAITPETGPVDMTLSALAIGMTVVAYRKYRDSRLEEVYIS